MKVLSFAIASFIAGLAGCLLAYRQGIITWESFAALVGLASSSTAYLAGVTSVFGGVQAGIIAAGGIVFYLTNEWFDLSGDWFVVISGVLVILTLMRNPEGIAAGGHELARQGSGVAHSAPRACGADAAAPTTPTPPVPAPSRSPRTAAGPDAPAVLEVDGLTVRYGGVVAVDDVALRVPAGGIVGLIGPNGAGKTSAIDAITGFARAEGTVALDGARDRAASSPTSGSAAASPAPSRPSSSTTTSRVEENVSAAAFGVKGDARHGAVQRALDLVGIADLRERNAGDLSQGQRQLVSIARACAADPHVAPARRTRGRPRHHREPAGSATGSATSALTGTGVLLVDHDVALVLDVCDYIYVLDFGRVIAEGAPDAIRADRAVVDAYLGHVHGAETGPAGAMTPPARVHRVDRRLRHHHGVPRRRPRPRSRHHRGAARSQRRGQDHAAPDDRRAASRRTAGDVTVDGSR